MPLHICILGIDGSGKSTVAAALPMLLAAELGLPAASAGEVFQVCAAGEDHLAPGFQPEGLPLAAHAATLGRRLARRFVSRRRLYPVFKVAQMLCQDAAAQQLGRRHRVACVVSDGNALLSTAGRAANYLHPASDGAAAPSVDAGDLRAALNSLLRGQRPPDRGDGMFPGLSKARALCRLLQLFRVPAVWLPDVVLLLDLSPRAALARIAARGRPPDRHENEADLDQARRMYHATVTAFRACTSASAAHIVHVEDLSPGEVLNAAVKALRPHLRAGVGRAVDQPRPLGTTAVRLTGASVWAKACNPRYLFGYFCPYLFRGAWREPFFPFARTGQLFLREGYSAEVMRTIYEQAGKDCNLFDRVFLGYPLHRAVYDRLQILTRHLEPELAARLRGSGPVKVLTAPSGYAMDLFRPLERLAAGDPQRLANLHLVAADLDPSGVLGEALRQRAERCGVRLTFWRGDLTGDEFECLCAAGAPYSLALFVGLSSWLPKPHLLRHLRRLRDHLAADGLLVTDCFTPAAYALSGRSMGYQANYYTPQNYRLLLDSCGFDGIRAEVFSGRDQINHVLLARRRPEA